MSASQSFAFMPCADSKPCARGDVRISKKRVLLGQQGACIPGSVAIDSCKNKLGEGCVCSNTIPGLPCDPGLIIIDIYIRNKTDQTMHLLKGGDIIRLVDTNNNPVEDSGVGWISGTFSPPQTIDVDETIFIRGYGYCIDKCCETAVTLQIVLQYSIGVTAKNLGTLTISVCRSKPKSKKCALFPGFLCDKVFGDVTVCPDASIDITPESSIYRVITAVLRESQVVVEVGGGQGPTGCSSDAQCPSSAPRCINNVCTGATGPNGKPKTNMQLIVVAVVAVVAVLLVFGFFFFLLELRKKK